MHQPWLLKAAAFQILKVFPQTAYDLLTTRLTKRSGTRQLYDAKTGKPTAYYLNAQQHAEVFSKHFDSEKDLLLEFGAGKDLLSNLLLCHLGVRNQLTVDLNSQVRPVYLNAVREQLPADAMAVQNFSAEFLAELRSLGIRYLAPFDMRKTALDAGSVAAIVSTNTLEHIPEQDIREILTECHRLLGANGICSFKIDYSDHYAHTDRTISKYNFLKFSDWVWRFLSPSDHYQNRLRHCDFATLFNEAGFDVLAHQTIVDPDSFDHLSTMKLAKKFRGYSVEDLAPLSGTFVLKTKSTGN